ncbi:MAG: hypothetical protein J6K98_02505 [Clostridia bacterium]|nr:hypothetical protein [Clostridia bacterium]
MAEFLCGAVGFLVCGVAFFAGMHYGARDRPREQEPVEPDEQALQKAAQEKRYTENFYKYTGDPQDTIE